MAFCPRCKLDLPTSEFWKDKRRKNGLQVYCKPCFMEYRRNWEGRKEVSRRWYHNKGKFVAAARRYGLTLDEYQAALAQFTVCRICRQEVTTTTTDGHTRLPSVDHDHATGKVRGLLCGNCNTGLGMFNEDVPTMQRAIKYLKEHKPNG